MDLTSAIDLENVAESFDEQKLEKLGKQVVIDFETDEDSRQEWLDRMQDWIAF